MLPGATAAEETLRVFLNNASRRPERSRYTWPPVPQAGLQPGASLNHPESPTGEFPKVALFPPALMGFGNESNP